MQTFLPYHNFRRTAQCLDYQRLGKQRVECKQIVRALAKGGSWSNHPATKMWRGYEKALGLYWATICKVWRERGYRDSLYPEAATYFNSIEGELVLPWWLGHESFHASHRSNLLRKKPDHYGSYGWVESSALPYLWPTEKRSVFLTIVRT